MIGDGQAQASPPSFPRHSVINPLEFFKNIFYVLFSNAYPLVMDINLNVIGILFNLYLQGGIFTGKFYGVAYEVIKNLLNFVCISFYFRQAVRNFDVYFYFLCRCHVTYLFFIMFDEVWKAEIIKRHFHLSGFYL